MKLVPLERFKLTWWSPGQPNTLHSAMFASLDQAMAEAETKGGPHLVMESVMVGDGKYQWKILPLGSYGLWNAGVRVYDARWVLAAILLIAGLHIISQNQRKTT